MLTSSSSKTGDIVLCPFVFTDLSSEKVRPAMVIKTFQEDVTLLFITTQTKHTHGVKIKASKENGLKIDSEVVVSKIATLDKKMILGKIGLLSNSDLTLVKKSLNQFLEL